MNAYQKVKNDIKKSPKRWLITGVGGFIGSNILEKLLLLNQNVVGLDNFSTGFKYHLEEVKNSVGEGLYSNFQLYQADIRSFDDCKSAVKDIDFVLHLAALGSVPRSIKDPITTNENNISGFLNMLVASKDSEAKSFTYASSSSIYGDNYALPKIEGNIGKPLSPYALTKQANEFYANVFFNTYNFQTIGIRYFNVFGKRQDPKGPYAAVIPKWTKAMIQGKDVLINGDGNSSRDFTFVDNIVQLNILAALAPEKDKNQIINGAMGGRTTLLDLFSSIKNALKEYDIEYNKEPVFREFREGDIPHSHADISKAREMLGYEITEDFDASIKKVMPWYIAKFGNKR